MLPRGGPTKRRGEGKSWKTCDVYPELTKLGNEKEFFSFSNELQKHWLLQSSGLNTTEATKKYVWVDDTQIQDRIADTPMPYVTRNRGHRDLLMKQIVQICIYLPWPLCMQPSSDWSQRGESLNLVSLRFEDWGIVFPVEWFSCQFGKLLAKAHTSGERRTPGCN